MGIPEQIAQIEQQIQPLETRLSSLIELYMRDGQIDETEGARLAEVQAQIDTLRGRIQELAPDEGGDSEGDNVVNIDFTDEEGEVIEVDTDREFGDAMYFNNEFFKSRFRQSVIDWSQNGAIGLNSISSYMNRQETPSGLSVMDLLPIIGLIFPESLIVTRTITLAPIVLKAFQDGVRAAGSSSTPSLNEIHAAWMGALAALQNTRMLDEKYLQYVTWWKSQQGIGPEVEQAWANVFGPACSNFATDHMPTSASIQKAFMGKVIETAEDGFDWNDSAGNAELEVLELVQNWSSPEGVLDDVPEAMLGAVQTVFSRSRVIELPVEITVIVRNVMGANMCEIKRSSRAPGNTDFRRESGDQAMFDDFVSQRIYNMFYVRHLQLD